jgi:hypothetical protein
MRLPELIADRKFEKIASLDVTAAARELRGNDDLWDQHQERTRERWSHSYGCSDIWVRTRAREELTGPDKFAEPHFPVFYEAWRRLPEIQKLVWQIVGLVKPVMVGAILITRVPGGKQIRTHDDKGCWNAEFMNFKTWTPLETHEDVVCRFPGHEVIMEPGDVVSVDNLIPHSVENYGKTDRRTLIVTMRVER